MICASCNAPNPAQSRFCSMCGEMLQHPTGRERRRVSVVFIDLTAFTTLTLGFDPEELRDLADEVLTVVAGVIEDYDGYVDAFRGDGLIALFGAPRSHPDDPQRAVLAAAAGLRAIEKIGRAKGYPLKGRAGVNTGIVIAGAVGSGRVRDYTVMGSTVNLAARLEAVAIPGEVWVGPETYESTRHRLLFQKSPKISLAGFPNVRHAYRLISSLEQYEADPYAHLAFVGRDEELATLESRFHATAAAGRAAEVWVVGEAGSGKTRLVREFSRRLESAGARTLWISGSPAGGHSWLPLARQLLGVGEGEEARVRKQRAVQALTDYFPGDRLQLDLILASLGLAASPPTASAQGTGAIARAWSDLVARAALRSNAGIVVAVDSNSRERQLLEFVAQLREAQAPVLLLRTTRERLLPAGADTLALEPLDLESSLALLNQLANPILRVATESLVFQVSGVPAYIIELGRALSTTRSGSFSGSLASLLQARLDLLEPQERRLLSLAALVGERSWENLLLDLAETGGDEELRRLLRENLLITEPSSAIPGEVAYRFQSDLLRHAVLRMIPFGDRPTLHLRVAAWLEQRAPLALSELIGYHFREGGEPEAAYPHYLAAADLAASQHDPHAEALFETLLALELPPALRAQGALAYAQSSLSAGNLERSREQLENAGTWLEAAAPEDARELREACDRLRADLERARQSLQAS